MENLISVIFKAGAEFGQKTLSKTVDLGSSVASKVLVAAMLTLALTSATFIGPVATKVPEMSWLRAASDIVRRELDRIAADK
jgi:hypothetical protein